MIVYMFQCQVPPECPSHFLHWQWHFSGLVGRHSLAQRSEATGRDMFTLNLVELKSYNLGLKWTVLKYIFSAGQTQEVPPSPHFSRNRAKRDHQKQLKDAAVRVLHSRTFHDEMSASLVQHCLSSEALPTRRGPILCHS